MALQRTLIDDSDPDYTTYLEEDSETGYLPSIARVEKSNSRPKRRRTREDLMRAAIVQFEGFYDNWPTMTSAERIDSIRPLHRAVAALIRHNLNED